MNPFKKKIKVVGRQNYIHAESGELIECQVVEMEERDANFDKIWLGHILEALHEAGNKKIELITFLIEKRDYNNNVIMTNREISKESGISYDTVSRTLKILEKNDIVRRKTGVIQLNPKVVFRGNYNQRMSVLLQYNRKKIEGQNESQKLSNAAD